MEAIAYLSSRQNLRSYMKQVDEDAKTLIVTNRDAEDTVIVLLRRDYDSMQGTLGIPFSNYVMEKIRRGDEQLSKGAFRAHGLIEVESNN